MDDHQVVLNGLNHYFESRFEIVFTLSNPQKLDAYIQKYKPEVLVMDIVLPEVNFLDLYKDTLEKYPKLRIIAYSSLTDTIVEQTLKKIGVEAMISKNAPIETLYSAILKKDLAEAKEEQEVIPELLKLTKTEIKIIEYLADGKSSKMMAIKMMRSYKTIDNHKQNIFKKMQVSNIGDLISKAYKWGVLK
ncbi:MAG: response regulator transcription factor [Flavobacteriales bacterium]|nr:response regulator transcription factor [Flavobacteriales bacterium]